MQKRVAVISMVLCVCSIVAAFGQNTKAEQDQHSAGTNGWSESIRGIAVRCDIVPTAYRGRDGVPKVGGESGFEVELFIRAVDNEGRQPRIGRGRVVLVVTPMALDKRSVSWARVYVLTGDEVDYSGGKPLKYYIDTHAAGPAKDGMHYVVATLLSTEKDATATTDDRVEQVANELRWTGCVSAPIRIITIGGER